MAARQENLRRFSRLIRSEGGTATIEFVFIFPVIMSLLLMSVEVGVMMARGMMLDRGIDMTMRELRLGALNPMTHDQMKKQICRHALIVPDCAESLSLELTPAAAENWTPTSSRPTCYDKAEEIKPALQFTPGSANELMIVSACATFVPFFPTTGLAATMKLQKSGEYAMIATSAYVNEP